MGKHFWAKHEEEQFEEYHPGCMSGVLHVLHYNHWHHQVKKMLPHRSHDRQRHYKSNLTKKTTRNVHECHEVQNLLEADASDDVLVNQTSMKDGTSRRSIISRMRKLIAEEMYKEKGYRKRPSNFSSRPKLQRTLSIHHLEPHHGFGKIRTNSKLPFIFPGKSGDTSSTRLKNQTQKKSIKRPSARNENFDNFMGTLGNQTNFKQADQNHGNSSHSQFEYDDVLEIFEVNKELFLKILKNTDDGFTNCFTSPKASKCKGRLTKSGSFPVADKSCSKNFRPSKLEHKYNEIWTLPKGENFLAGANIAKDQFTKSGNLMTADSGESELDQETSFSSPGSAQELDKRWSDEVVMDLLKDIKQRIEHEVQIGIEEGKFVSRDTPHICNPSTSGEETESRKDDQKRNIIKDGSSSKDFLKHFGRSSSLNESMDRYARLFDYSLGRDAKLHVSKSLRLSNEYEIRSRGHDSRSSRRICSLSHLDFNYYPLPNEETFNDNLSEIQCRTATDFNPKFDIDGPICTESFPSLGIIKEIDEVERLDVGFRMESLATSTLGETDKGTAEIDKLIEEREEVTVEQSNSYEEQEISFSEVVDADLPQPSPVTKFEIQEDSNCRSNYIDEKEFDKDPLPVYESKGSTKNQGFIGLSEKDDTDFNYVRTILELSGFLSNGKFRAWHLFDQPLNPSLFEEVEARWIHEEDTTHDCFRHLLLFDMINEVLLQIFDKSCTYYPRALSRNCGIRPMPVGYRVLEEVWKSTSMSLILLGSEPEKSLDDLIAQDFMTDDWMNLQLESESVALELEDLIFGELIDETIFS